ncbi:MAG: AmmeMemoRadiSam system protein B [Oligosphaeraceae bacterium]|nr:AmmeMemoRadiSam system protein B [Oligosphaeraceae bacterium]
MSTGIFAEVRNSQCAGAFYPGEAKALRHEIERLLQEAEDCAAGREIFAAAVPHAGYVYSAAIAAPVFKALSQAAFDTIVIIGHDFGRQAPGIIGVLPDFNVYRTPLGDMPVDTALRDALRRDEPRLISNNQVHSAEHSIEVQLPFLQITHPQVKILPLLFGEVTPEHCRALVEVLEKNCGSRRLMILSSTDLAHYPSKNTAASLDGQTISFAEHFDLPGLCQWKDGGDWMKLPGVETPICSAGGLGVAMLWAQRRGATRALTLKRGTSGDIPGGDNRRVVSYTSLLFVKDSPGSSMAASEAQTAAAEGKDFLLSAEAQRYLLGLARQRITAAVRGQSWQLQAPGLAEVQQPGAVFVTLHKEQRLRGCIGTTRAEYPLYQAVAELAYAAAFEDSRFPQLTAAELPALAIEISVLSPLQPVSSAAAIVPGKHGVVVRRDGRSGLFLPQVWEQLPAKEDFLDYLCAEKAGLPARAWKESGTALYVFTVFAFAE